MKEKDLRKIINEQVRIVLSESDLSTSLERDLGGVLNNFSKMLPTVASTQEKNSEQLNNESVLLTLAGFNLAFPGILKLIASFGKKGAEIINKKLGNKPGQNKSEQFFNDIITAADHLHHIYLKPIELVVKNIFRVQDPEKAHKISNLVFHAIVATMLFYSGIGAVKAFKSKELASGTLESALSAVKTGELRTFLLNSIAEFK
jgi:hypothetical protein